MKNLAKIVVRGPRKNREVLVYRRVDRGRSALVLAIPIGSDSVKVALTEGALTAVLESLP